MSCLWPRVRSTSAGGRAAGWMDCFQAPALKTEKKDETAIVRRGEDLWAEGIEGTLARGEIPVHLVIMVNGLVGR